MIEQAIGNTGAVPREVSADAGYYSAKAVDGLSALGVDPFIAPDKTRHETGNTAVAPGAYTQQSLRPRPDAAEAAHQEGPGALRPAQADRGTGVWSDQAGPGLPAVPAAGTGEGEPGMAADLLRTQPAQAVPVRARVNRQGGPRPLGKNPLLAAALSLVRRWECYRPQPTNPVVACCSRLVLNQSGLPQTGC